MARSSFEKRGTRMKREVKVFAKNNPFKQIGVVVREERLNTVRRNHFSNPLTVKGHTNPKHPMRVGGVLVK